MPTGIYKRKPLAGKYKEEMRKRMIGNTRGSQKRGIPWNKNRKIDDYPQSGFQKGHPPYFDITGNQNPSWIDGRAKENNLYPEEWIDDLREIIRKRDGYICQLCGIHQDEMSSWNKKLDVHHIDYDKDNLNPDNLISLCRSCHQKTNFNREYWEQYFQVI